MGIAAAGGIYVLAEKIIQNAGSNLSIQPNTQSSSTISNQQSGTIVSHTQVKSTGITSTVSQNKSSTSTSRVETVPSGYTFLASLNAVNGRSYAYFNHPKFGSSILINYNGSWKAFSAICTHAGCTVNLTSAQLYCPCHAGYFSPVNGAVTGGPPPSRLAEYDVREINNNLYVGDSIIN